MKNIPYAWDLLSRNCSNSSDKQFSDDFSVILGGILKSTHPCGKRDSLQLDCEYEHIFRGYFLPGKLIPLENIYAQDFNFSKSFKLFFFKRGKASLNIGISVK
jgi:hypothetical protein